MREPLCDHDWNTTSNLRLVIHGGDMEAMMASFVPTAPRLLQVGFCRKCGALSIGHDTAKAIAALEREQASGGSR